MEETTAPVEKVVVMPLERLRSLQPVKSYLDFLPSSCDSAGAPNYVVPMTREQTELMMRVYLREMDAPPVAFDFLHEDKWDATMAKMFAFQVFQRRIAINAPDTQMTLGVMLFVLSMCDRPGQVVMWAYTMHRLYQREKSLITMAVLCCAFPFGFLSEEGEHVAWDAQKRRGGFGDNGVDKAEYWA